MADIVLSNHAKYRLSEREIDVHEAKKIAKSGKIGKIDSDGTTIKTGKCSNGKFLIVVCKKEGNKTIIKTAYYEN